MGRDDDFLNIYLSLVKPIVITDMKRLLIVCVFVIQSMCCSLMIFAQGLNLSFEDEQLRPWYRVGQPENYIIEIDSVIKFDGDQSLFIQNAKPSQSFGGVMHMIPKNIKGDSIEISAMVKLKDVTSPSKLGFMLRIDPQVYFNNFDDADITGTADWKRYKIKAKLNPNRTSAIFLGVFLSGEGSIWADGFKVKVDGKDLTDDLYTDYKMDFSNISRSGVSEFKNTPEVTAKLADLGKIWGLLKYRHPELAKGNHEWDVELFKAINHVIGAKSHIAVEKYYTTLLDSLGAVEPSSPSIADQEIVQAGSYSWIKKLPFNPELNDRLLGLRYASFTDNYYYSFNPGVGNVKIENEYPYSKLQDPDVGFRLLSLFRFWNIVQYFSPYRSLTDTSWDDVLAAYIPKMIEANDQLKYESTVAAMLSEIKDAHTKLWGDPKALNAAIGLRVLPIELTFAEGKPIVTQSRSIEESQLKKGDVIVKKNGREIKEIQDSVCHLIASPNPAVIEREMADILRRSINESDALEIDRNGERINLDVSTVSIKDFKAYRDTVAVKYLDGGIAYLNHGNLTTEILKANQQKLEEANGILIDYRNYPKDFLVFVLTPYLLPETTEFVKFSKTGYQSLGDFMYSPTLKVGQANPDYYKGKVAILVNQHTQSSAEYHTMAYRTAPKASVFGSQTAGADGNVSFFQLPGGLTSSISGIGVYYPDGTETQRIGIVPDVEVKPTISGIRAGRDEVMEAALKYLDEK